jgi:hypothetical protein
MGNFGPLTLGLVTVKCALSTNMVYGPSEKSPIAVIATPELLPVRNGIISGKNLVI